MRIDRDRRDAVLAAVALLAGSAVFGLVFSGDPQPLHPTPSDEASPLSVHASR